MKNRTRRKTGIALTLSLACFIMGSIQSHARDISGIWSSDRHQVTLEVVATVNGIKVLRSGQGQWYYYQRVNPSTFRDNEGNVYRFRDNDYLEWRSYDSRRSLRFRKGRGNQRYDRTPPRPRRTLVTPRALRGSWVDYRSGDCLDIRSRRNSIRVSGIGLFTRTFHPSSSGFMDHKGNVLKIENNRLIHINRRGRVQGVFRR